MLLDSIKMSWENIIHNKLRSFLTMLGIVIGVASIIALISIVQSASDSISEEVRSLGIDRINVTITGTLMKKGLNERDLDNILELKGISGVSPTVTGITSIVYGQNTRQNVRVLGKNEVYFRSEDDIVRSGRSINILDVAAVNKVTLIGSDIVKDLFYGIDPIGKKININGTAFTVIGTLESTGLFSGNSNDIVLIPYTTAFGSLGINNVSSVDIYISDPASADEAASDINRILNAAFNYDETAYRVYNMSEMIESFQTIMSTMSLLLAGIAGISLIVGGIGIMNMMLVSVTERTSEIGLRKALGATPQRIQLQFIIESVFLSIIGGAAGFAVGNLAAFIIASLMGIDFSVSFATVALAVGFSVAVGIIFGYMPARKASRLNPIDALRNL